MTNNVGRIPPDGTGGIRPSLKADSLSKFLGANWFKTLLHKRARVRSHETL